MAAGTKRGLEDSSGTPKAKKSKVEEKRTKAKDNRDDKAEKPSVPASNLVQDEVDFPRGGGTSFTPLEVKAIRAEAVKEANEELFNVRILCVHYYLIISTQLPGGQGETGKTRQAEVRRERKGQETKHEGWSG